MPAPTLGAAPAYSRGLEFTVSLLTREMDPARKLILARRMLEVFRHLEQQALAELAGLNDDRG